MGNKHSSYGVNGGYELSKARIEMLSAQTGLPNGKIVEWFEDFKSECKNGELNRKSFVRFYKELLPKKSADSEKYCEFVFNAFDSDKSGSIDFSEFLLSLSLSSHGSTRDKLNWIFEMYDLDHNSFIDVKEMTKVLQAIYKLMNVQETQSNSAHERAHAIFKQLDINKDKLLSREEFVAGCENDDFLRCLLAPNL